MLLFLIGALRAVIEMLGLALLGLAVMHVLAGSQRDKNPIYQLFALITRAPRRLAACLLLNKTGPGLSGLFCFILLFALWFGLALLRATLV
jgi:hypothetical protein